MPVWTIADFEAQVKKGKKLHILDNLILDLSSFASQHPGGTFLIEQTAGRDISKYFYGGYSLDANHSDPNSGQNPVHAHSNLARKVVQRHVVAYLEKAKVVEPVFELDDMDHTKIHSSTVKTLHFKLVQSESAAMLPNSSLQKYYSDFESFGKHFTIVHMNPAENDVRTKAFGSRASLKRHYTICNVMRPGFFHTLVHELNKKVPSRVQNDSGS